MIEVGSYDGWAADRLRARLAVPRAEVFASVDSTQDVAFRLAREGAPAGTVVLADRQTAGRGRAGRVWRSDAGAGVCLSVIERPDDPAAMGLLSLRVGLELAMALDALAQSRVGLKWPNDLYLKSGKLGGVLIEAQWHGRVPEFVSIGVGINVQIPQQADGASALPAGVTRLAALVAAVPAVRRAAAERGPLTTSELHQFASRDIAVGRRCTQPVLGTVRGIDASGALIVESDAGRTAMRTGSLVLQEVS